MLFKKIVLYSTLTIGSMLSLSSQGCSRVFYNFDSSYLVSGRNLDYFSPADPTLVITPRGILHGNNKFSWKTKYGSVVIYADNLFPLDGMNEKGLVGHTLYFEQGSQDQKNNRNKPVLSSEFWLSYLLDNNATVNEAIQSLKNVRLTAPLIKIDYDTNTKHIGIEDATGDSAVIEIIDGNVSIYHNKDYRVVTNTPNYQEQLENLKKYNEKNIPSGATSPDRFVRGMFNVKRIPPPRNDSEALGSVLSVINNLALPPNAEITDPAFKVQEKFYTQFSKYPQNNRGITTYWQTLSDISHQTYYFKSINAVFPIFVIFNEINFNARQPIRAIRHLNQYYNQKMQGDVLKYATVIEKLEDK